MPCVVNVRTVFTARQNTNATVSFGENLQYGWSSPQKRMNNVNIAGAANVVLFTINILKDNDVFDTFIRDGKADTAIVD